MEAPPLVLLIDDDSSARGGYAELLESRGFRVMVAGSAKAAVTRCHECAPDVVVTDIALPDRDGFELAADLRKQSIVRDMPILAMTAYWATDVYERAARAGITTILAKPCQPDHLVAELRRALGKSRPEDTTAPMPESAEAAASKAVRLAMDAYLAALRTNDSAKISALWTSDAIFMAPGVPSRHGRAELESYLASAFSAGRVEYDGMTVDDVEVASEVAAVVGTYTVTRHTPAEPPRQAAGRYMFICRRQADWSWKIAKGMSTDLP